MSAATRGSAISRGHGRRRENQWLSVLNNLVRGASGGFLFSIPLLYTMEVWWVGSYLSPPRMLAALATAFIVVALLNRIAGFHRKDSVRLIDVLLDTGEALALSVLCSVLMLLLLRLVRLETPVSEIVGKIVIETVPFSIGVALANQMLSGGRSQDENDRSDEPDDGQPAIASMALDLGATAIGAIFIAFSIAPTAEVPMLAAGITAPWMIGLIAFSVLLSYAIVFQAGFGDQRKRHEQQGIFQRPLNETLVTYLVSLAIAGFMLWFFKQLNFDDPWSRWLSLTVVLGLPATVGGAAGRLAV